MVYIVTKIIKGNPYLYEVKSVREGDRVRQVFVRYLGRADKPSREYSETEPVERKERIRRPAVATISEAVTPTVAVEAEIPAPVESTPIEEITPLVTPALEVEPEATKEIGETITLYRASPNLPTGGSFEKGTYFADSAEKALYYSESHYRGDVSDIKVQQFILPKDVVVKEGVNYRLTGETLVSPIGMLRRYGEVSEELLGIEPEPTPMLTPALEVTKEPWEMTQTEFFATSEGKPTKQFPINVKHRASVEKALSEGKPVPSEVLKDYPELSPKPTPEVMVTPIEPEITRQAYIKKFKDVGFDFDSITSDMARENRPPNEIANAKQMFNFMADYARIANPEGVISDAEIATLASGLSKRIDSHLATMEGNDSVAWLRLEKDLKEIQRGLNVSSRSSQVIAIDHLASLAHQVDPSVIPQIFGQGSYMMETTKMEQMRSMLDHVADSKIIPRTEPVTPANPYMNMPIERVRRDATHGVKLAKEALAVREAVTPEVIPAPEVELYHGTVEEFADTDIVGGKRMFGIHLTTDESVAKTYSGKTGSIKKYSLASDAKVLDLSDGDTLWEYMKKEGILDTEDIADADLENYVKSGQLYQYDISSKTYLADDVAKTAKSQGYDVVKMADNLGGGDNVAYVVVNKDKLAIPKAEAGMPEVTKAVVTPTAPAVEPTPKVGEVMPSDIMEFSQIKSPKEYQDWIQKQNVDLPYANFLRDIGKITEDPRYNYKEDEDVWLNEVGRNQIIKKAIQAHDSGIIDKVELQGFIDEFYEKQELTIDELIGYHKGTYKPSAIPQADKPMSTEEMDTIMDEYFTVKPPTAPAGETVAKPEGVTIYHAKTKGEFPTGKPSTDIGSDADILGKGFYFGTKEYASRYGTPEAYTISGKFATQEQWIEALAKYGDSPIKEQRASARGSLQSEGYVGVRTKEVGVVWDDKAIQSTPRAEVAPIPPEITTTNEIRALHVTSNPQPVIDALKSGKNLGETRAEGLVGDLGASGLYVSNNPQMWIGRATSKWHFLKELTPDQKDKLIGKVIQSVDEQMKYGGIADFEYQNLMRDINYVKEGKLDAEVLVSAANQPFNIAFWKPEYLSDIGIEQANLPIEVPVTAKGKFADVTKVKGGMTQDLIDSLKAQGYDGMIHRGSWGTPEQTVIWNPKAIESFGEYTQPAIPKTEVVTPEITTPNVFEKDFIERSGQPEFYTPETKIKAKPFTQLISTQYDAGLKTQVRNVHIGKVQGQEAWADGFMLEIKPVPEKLKSVKGYRELAEDTEGKPRDFSSLVPDYSIDGIEVKPILKTDLEAIKGQATFLASGDKSQAIAIDSKYVDYFLANYPDAKFITKTGSISSPINIQSKGKTVGTIMPIFKEKSEYDTFLRYVGGGEAIAKTAKPEKQEVETEVKRVLPKPEPKEVTPELAKQILEGYRNLGEAREALSEFADRDVVGYTARGEEVTPDMLRQAIDIKSVEPKIKQEPNINALLAHLREAPQSKSTENYLRKTFGDEAVDQAHQNRLVTRTPKGIYTITVSGRETIKSIPSGKVNLYAEGKRILAESITIKPETTTATFEQNITKAVEERPSRISHGYTAKNAFYVTKDNRIIPADEFSQISRGDDIVSVHSHSGENWEQYTREHGQESFQPPNAADFDHLRWLVKQGYGNKLAVIMGDGRYIQVEIPEPAQPRFTRMGRKTLEKLLYPSRGASDRDNLAKLKEAAKEEGWLLTEGNWKD